MGAMVATATRQGRVWSNFAGNQRCMVKRIERPVSLSDLERVLADATQAGLRVRAVGTGHSWAPIVCPADVLVELRAWKRMVLTDPVRRLVAVQPGVTFAELAAFLERRGLTLGNYPVPGHLSVVGAIATASHGSGHTGTVADFVRRVHLLTAAGDTLVLDTTHNDLFKAAAVSLGALGIVLEVTLQCEPLFLLRRRPPVTLPLDDPRLDTVLRMRRQEWSFPSLFWNWRARTVTIQGYDRRPWTAAAPPSDGWPPSAVLLSSGGHGQRLEAEAVIPVARSLAALFQQMDAILVPVLQAYRYPDDVVFTRLVAQDRTSLLSPTARDAPWYLLPLWRQNTSGSLVDYQRSLPFYRAMEQKTRAAPFGALPHWGKIWLLPPPAATLATFRRVQTQLDPNGRFAQPRLLQDHALP